MDIKDNKPKVRVVKAGQKMLKSGVIRVEGEQQTLYRGPCDRCAEMVTLKTAPVQGQELLCSGCIYVARVGKPSTLVKRKGEKVLFYNTECDVCGDRDKTPFLPKKSRPYLCDLCYAESDEGQAGLLRKKEADSASLAKKSLAKKPEPCTQTASQHTVEENTGVERRVYPPSTHMLTCKRCRKRHELRFKPGKGEAFICPECYEKASGQEEKRLEHPSASMIFNIECVECGKHETVNFVPKSLTEAVCTECFEKRRI